MKRICLLLFAAMLLVVNSYGQKKKVAVVSAVGPSVSQDIRMGLSIGLQQGIYNSGQYTLLSRGAAFEKALSEMKFQRSGAVSDDQLTAFGHAAGADYVGYAMVVKYSENDYLINYKMIDVVSGEIIRMGTETVTNGVDGLFTATKDMSKNMFDASGNSSNGNNPTPLPVIPSPAPNNHSITAYLNYNDIVTTMPEYKQMQASLKNSQDESQAELKAMSDEYTQKLSDYVAQQDNLNESIKVRRQQELQNLQQRAQDFQQSAAQKQEALQQRLLTPIQEKLQNAINEVGKENNFLYIINHHPNDSLLLYIAPQSPDVTSMVKRMLGIQTTSNYNPAPISNDLSPIAYFKSGDVIPLMPETKQMMDKLKESGDAYQAELQSMSDEYTKKMTALTEQQDALSQDVKALRMREIDRIRDSAETLQQQAQQSQTDLQQSLFAPILAKITKILAEIGAENHYAYIINHDPNTSLLLYISPQSPDVTSMVKRMLGIQTPPDNKPAPISNNLSPAAYFKSGDVIPLMPETKQMMDKLKESGDAYQAKLQSISDEYTKKMTALTEQQDALSQDVKALRMREIDRIRESAETLQQQAQQSQTDLQQALFAPILAKVMKVLEEIGTDNHYAYIINYDPNANLLLYLSPNASDVTSLVKRKLGI